MLTRSYQNKLSDTRSLVQLRFGFYVGIRKEGRGRGTWSTGRNGARDKMSLACRESDIETGSKTSRRLKSENRAEVRTLHPGRRGKEAQKAFITDEKRVREVHMKPILKGSVFSVGSSK